MDHCARDGEPVPSDGDWYIEERVQYGYGDIADKECKVRKDER